MNPTERYFADYDRFARLARAAGRAVGYMGSHPRTKEEHAIFEELRDALYGYVYPDGRQGPDGAGQLASKEGR